MNLYADKILKADGLTFASLDENDAVHSGILKAVEENTIEALGYFLKPSELFSAIAATPAGRSLGA